MTDDIADPLEHQRRTSDMAKRNRLRREAVKATRHTIANVRYGNAAYILCTCGWSAHGDHTDASWKTHKKEVGERTHL